MLGALWLLSFSSSSFVTLLGGLRSVTGSAWLAAPTMLCNRRCLRPRWLAGFPRKAPEQPSTAALCTLVLLFLILCLGFSFTFFLCPSYFFIYVFAWFILTCFHNFSAPCTCTNHIVEKWGLFIKKDFGCNCKIGSLHYPLACYTHRLDYQTNILS